MDDVLCGLERRQIVRQVNEGYRLSDSTLDQLSHYSDEGQLKLFER
jgi:hypothetical protein